MMTEALSVENTKIELPSGRTLRISSDIRPHDNYGNRVWRMEASGIGPHENTYSRFASLVLKRVERFPGGETRQRFVVSPANNIDHYLNATYQLRETQGGDWFAELRFGTLNVRWHPRGFSFSEVIHGEDGKIEFHELNLEDTPVVVNAKEKPEKFFLFLSAMQCSEADWVFKQPFYSRRERNLRYEEKRRSFDFSSELKDLI